ncbi:hypothetical protein ARGLB_113_00110 [Arthrobacter globiformis NBRC 12137]|uniref:Uncharacterized protein n=1 Tax=Arthrobacter globiformis (strain ATCC 8010 / DSM 20124 / JCM 1332 / NBRC 12137 / NCIMB 8907 / NRRL B-2979 / 168) TaxID=1077972 RepID=H0QTK4_ARTG1|nr:hypothetical protein [Arthrobacter globiformis]GAB16155.1 hypothetical protein ARGLB_113_00110 [Arthrobacter globiformis NBRC 12137]
MKKLFILIGVFLGSMVTSGPVAAAPVEPIAFDFTTTAGDVCAFPVLVEVAGKSKEIGAPGDDSILIAPGLKATFTNTLTGKSVSYVITGATHNQTLANGNVVSTVTGRNTIVNSIAFNQTIRPGIFLVEGTFRFELNGPIEVHVFSGTGRVTDVCAFLAR